ncbi:MAG TPA: hypothetical protein VK982_09490 [Bacteroidales bacterium]|nr:hypothetical protein [Bacteroidales bacterium]
MKIKAFGVARFAGEGKQKSAVVCIEEINQKLESLQISAENVINIQADTEFYHVFYRTE